MDSPFMAMIMLSGFDWAPKYWAFCNGQLMAINQNTALFSLLGTTYGGNGTTTFGLPDLRGRAIIGQDVANTLGFISGTTTTTLLASNMPAHTHSAGAVTLNAVSGAGNVTAPAGNYLAASRSATTAEYIASGTTSAMNAGSITGTTGVGGASTAISIMQPYLALNYVIALQGIYPSRN